MALPGVRAVDHFGFTVPDLEAAGAWLVDVIGCEYLYSLGPFDRPGEWMATHLAVDPAARMERLHFFRLGGQAIFEVFQYAAPDRVETPPRNSDVGGHHVALYVDDMDEAVAHLRRHGTVLLGEPTVSSGPSEGQRWLYFLSPWGMQWELVSYPGGKAFDRAGGTAEAWAAAQADAEAGGD